MSSADVLIERRGAVALVTLNLARRRNALGVAFSTQLGKALTDLQDEPDLRTLVLYGGEHFCAGGDLEDLNEPMLAMRLAMQRGQRSVRALSGGRLASVAAVQGGAFGAGFSLAMACDFVVGDANSTFAAVFNRVGLQPDYGLLWSLPQRVGIAKARELVLLGTPVKGEQAHQIGLLDRLAAPGAVLDTAMSLAQELAQLPPGTVASTKAVLSRLPLTLDTALAWEADTQTLLLGSEDFAEGVRAYAQRRIPEFKGR